VENDTLDLDEIDKFQIAFLVQDMHKGEARDDHRYVEWYGAVIESDGVTEKIA